MIQIPAEDTLDPQRLYARVRTMVLAQLIRDGVDRDSPEVESVTATALANIQARSVRFAERHEISSAAEPLTQQILTRAAEISREVDNDAAAAFLDVIATACNVDKRNYR